MPSSLSLDHWRTSSCVCWTWDKCIILVLRLCDIHCVVPAVRPYTEETYSDDTMTVYQVPIFGGFVSWLLLFLFLNLRKEFVCHLIFFFFYAVVSAAKSRDNDRNRSHRSGRNSPTQATPQKADVSSADDPGESEQARLDMQYYTDKIHFTTWGCSIQIKQKASTKTKSNLKIINNHLK